jgi:hypothetical protein
MHFDSTIQDSSASFIALRDVSNSVGSDAVTVMLEWCESPCVSISRTDCANRGDMVLDNAAAPAAPLSPSLCPTESDFESVSFVPETLSALMEDD